MKLKFFLFGATFNLCIFELTVTDKHYLPVYNIIK